MSASAHRLLVLTPSLAKVSIGYRDTSIALTEGCRARGLALMIDDAADPGQLVHARNVLYAGAINSTATHVLWWDADVAWVVNSGFFDLLQRPEPMIARAYPMRAFDFEQLADRIDERLVAGDLRSPRSEWLRRNAERWTAQIDFEGGAPTWSDDGHLVRIASCGFGWVLMRVDAMREFAPPWSELPRDWRGRRSVDLFNLQSPGGITHGEDTSFCARWRASGRTIWCEPGPKVQNGEHGGRFADYLHEHGFDPPKGASPP